MLFVSVFMVIRVALLVIVACFLGMGGIAPWERVASVLYAHNTKGLLNVKKDICGWCPSRRNTGGSC